MLDLNPKTPSRKPNELSSPSASSTKQQPTDRSKLLECRRCGGTNHIAKFCRWKGRAKPSKARGGSSRSHGTSVKAVVHPGATDDATSTSLLNPALDKALSEIVTTMHTITSQQEDCSAQLGPTLTAEIQIEGCPVTALLDTGSPVTIVLLDFLLQTLAKQKKPRETTQARIEEKLKPPSIPLCSYEGQPLSIVGQMTVDICRGDNKAKVKVHIQQGAPVCVLVGTDVLPRLGLSYWSLVLTTLLLTACLSKSGRESSKPEKGPQLCRTTMDTRTELSSSLPLRESLLDTCESSKHSSVVSVVEQLPFSTQETSCRREA